MDSSKNIILLVDSECIPYDCTDAAFENNLRILKLTFLKLLCYFNYLKSCCTKNVNLRWGHKIFSSLSDFSCSVVHHRSKLNEITLDSYEDFEDVLSRKLQRLKKRLVIAKDHVDSSVESISRDGISVHYDTSEGDNNGAHSSIPKKLCGIALTKVLRELLHEYEWNVPQIFSPVKKANCFHPESLIGPRLSGEDLSTHSSEDIGNIVFLFSRCPDSLCQLETFTKKSFSSIKDVASSDILQSFLPNSLQSQFHEQTKIKLLWIDTSPLFHDSNSKFHGGVEVKNSIRTALHQVKGNLVSIEELTAFSTSNKQCRKLSIFSKSTYTDFIYPSTVFLNFYIKPDVQDYSLQNSNSIQVSIHMGNSLINLNAISRLLQSTEHVIPKNNQEKECAREEYFFIASINKGIFPCQFSTRSLLCVPMTESESIFSRLISKLIDEDAGLVLADSKRGGLASAVFFPVSAGIGHIMEFEPCKQSRIWQKLVNLDLKPVCDRHIESLGYLYSIVEEAVSSVSCTYDSIKEKPVSDVFTERTNHQQSACLFTSSSVENWYISNHQLNFNFENTPSVSERTDILFRKLKKCYRSSTTKYPQDSYVKKTGEPDQSSVQKVQFQCKQGKDFENDQAFILHLKSSYDITLNSGSCFVTYARNVMNELGDQADNDFEKMEHLLFQNLMLSSSQVAEKYSDSLPSDLRMNEYQLQTVLLLENELRDPLKRMSNANAVIAMLRNMSFLFGLTCLSTFLSKTIYINYLPALEDIIVQICKELDQPLPSGLGEYSSDDDQDGDSDTSSVRTDICSFSQSSVTSSASSGSFLNPDSVKANLRRSDRRSNLGKRLQQRQIVVTVKGNGKKKDKNQQKSKPKLEKSKTTSDIEKTAVRRNLFSNASPARLKRRNTTCGVIQNSPQKSPNKLSRTLLLETPPKKKTPKVRGHQKKQATTPKGRHVLKTTYVPATPEHKEGSLGIIRKQQRLRRRIDDVITNETVEESPDKLTRLGLDSVLGNNSQLSLTPFSSKSAQFKDFSPCKSRSSGSPSWPIINTPTKGTRSRSASKALFRTPTKPFIPAPKKPEILSPRTYPHLRSSEGIQKNLSPQNAADKSNQALSLEITNSQSNELVCQSSAKKQSINQLSLCITSPVKVNSSDGLQNDSKVVSASPTKNYARRKVTLRVSSKKSPQKALSNGRFGRINVDDNLVMPSEDLQSTPKKFHNSYQKDFSNSLFKNQRHSFPECHTPVETDSFVRDKLADHCSIGASNIKNRSLDKRRCLRLTAERQSRKVELLMQDEGSGQKLEPSSKQSKNLQSCTVLPTNFTCSATEFESQRGSLMPFTLECDVSLSRLKDASTSVTAFDTYTSEKQLMNAYDASSSTPKNKCSPEKLHLQDAISSKDCEHQTAGNFNVSSYKISPGKCTADNSSLPNKTSQRKRRYSALLSEFQKKFTPVQVQDCAPQRITRNLSRDIGLSPETVRCLSLPSPQHQASKKLKANSGQTSSDKRPLVKATPTELSSYTPPSVESILHLTSSPMLRHDKGSKKPVCRKRLM